MKLFLVKVLQYFTHQIAVIGNCRSPFRHQFPGARVVTIGHVQTRGPHGMQ